MSLKAFHVVFVIASVLMCLGFGLWELGVWRETGGTTDLILGVVALVAVPGLLVYGWFFLKKLKNISYL